MATNVRQYRITFKNIKDGQIPCSNPIVKLLNVSDNVVQKCVFENNSVMFSIYESAIDGLQGTCINFVVLCETCKKCEPVNGKLCFCNNFTDCDPCQDCINGTCVNRCPDMLCVDDKCVNCEDEDDCKNNQICISGKCKCPPTLPYYDEVGEKCYGCKTDEECGPCRRCVDGSCQQMNCICDEELNDCVECTQASHCGINECCVDNKCKCCPGYIYDAVLDQCVEEPECTGDDDCEDPCKICVFGDCEDIICPDPNEVCIDGICGPIPCEGPCDDATDCGPDCGCLEGECVDCASLDCVTCAQTIGCKCVNGDCQKDDSPCAQYSCETNCGERPDCGCQEDGSCEEVECEGESTLSKNEDECKLEYNLETSVCCECPKITVDNKIMSIQNSPILRKYAITSRVEVRKGDAPTPLAILDLHRVDEDQYDDIMDNEEATQGQVQVTATYTYEGLSGGAPTGVLSVETVLLTPIFDLAGVGFDEQKIYVNIPGEEYPKTVRVLRSVTLTYTLISELTFESGCTYDEGVVIGTYTFDDILSTVNFVNQVNQDTPGQDSNVNYWIAKTLTSDVCRNPEAKWYKAPALENGSIGVFESVPFRKTYLTKLTPTTFTDFIDEPDENPGPSDNNGELFSGYFYKVATDCACTNEATAYYESTCENPGRVVFCDPQEASVEFDECGKSFTFLEAFITDCLPNYDYYGDNADFVPDGAKLRYSIHVNGSDTALLGSTVIANAGGVIYNAGQEFTSSELIEYIEIRWSHDNCDECTIRIDSTVDLDLPTYTIICEPSGATDVTYTITFTFPTGVDEVIVGSNTATSGSPTITITLANTVQEVEMEIVRDGCASIFEDINLPENCCDDLTVTLTQDATNCDEDNYNFVALASPAISGSYSFSVNNVFVESNTDGLFSIAKNVGGVNEPNTVKVIFTPSSDLCAPVNKTLNIDKTFGFSLISSGGSPVAVCGSGATSTNVVYSVPTGVTGNVTYNVTGAGDVTVAVNGPTPLTINVAGTPTETKILTIVSNTLVDSTGNGCASFTPDPVTINFVTSPSVSGITALPVDPCEEADVTVTVNGTAGAIATVNAVNIIGTWAGYPYMTVGVPYIVTAGTAGNLTLNVTNVAASGCSVPASANTTIVVKDKPEVTSFTAECETPGSPTSNIDLTILGTTGATVSINPTAENVVLIESPSGTYTGTLDDTYNGSSIVVRITKNGCYDETTEFIEACACDPDAEATIRLVGTPITEDSGCEGEGVTYNVITTGLNGGVTYAWRLDSPTNPSVLGTASSYLYTFDDNTHVLYVTATDEEGCEAIDSIVVEGFPNPVFSINVPSLCVGTASNITYTITSGTVSSRQWKLDGVNVSTAAVYSYTPADTADHDISLTITTTDGCVDTVTVEDTNATVCCIECTTQNVNVPAERVLSFTDDDGNTYTIPGVYYVVCVEDPDSTVINNATALAIENFLRAIDPCGAEVNVTWEDSTIDPECIKFIVTDSTLVFDFVTMGSSGEYTFDTSGC
jgi:hypothetical protein